MRRDEQMMNAAEAYAEEVKATFTGSDEDKHQECLVAINDFCAGWRAADNSRWIPVEDELPKVSGDYIICEKRGFVKEAHYFELDDLWMLPGGALVSPTHWMPLPQPPQGKEE